MSPYDVPRPLRISMLRGARTALLALGFCFLTSLAGAQADPSASDRATARALAGEGNAALKKKDFATAEDRFRRADELVHAPSLVVDHARALAGLGRLGEAYERYESVIREELPSKAPWAWKQAVAAAHTELDALRPRLAWLILSVKGPSDPTVEMDGRLFPPESLGARKPANPGERHIVVSAKGFISKELKVALAEGADKTIEVELLPQPKPKPIVVRTPVVESPAEIEVERKTQRNRTLAYVGFGVGGIGLATGAVAGILWLKARSDIVDACGGLSCEAAAGSSQRRRYEDDKRRYDTLGTISGVGFAVGVVGAATGAALILFEPAGEVSEEASGGRVIPYVGVSSLGVRGRF